MDPRTPIIVGIAQANQRESEPEKREPIDLMRDRAQEAAQDAGCPSLVERADAMGIMQGIWPYPDPGQLLKDRLSNAKARTQVRPIGGNEGQDLILSSLDDIQAGRSDVVLVCSAETMRTRRSDQKAGRKTRYSDVSGDGDIDHLFSRGNPMLSPHEAAAGMGPATVFYAMIENAIRHESQSSFAQHQDKIAKLWSSLSQVASDNPHAWIREPKTSEMIAQRNTTNRPITHPYPKWMTSNIDVDQSAALWLTSVETAQSLGIPRDRWVFPWSGVRTQDHWFPSQREHIHRSPAMRIGGRLALEIANVQPESLDWIDLYACFPAAVQVAQTEIGISPDQIPSVTGGLTFFGGPFNSFTLHSVARTVELARNEPNRIGFVSGVGGYFTKHSFGVYSATPPQTPYRFTSPQAEIDALPHRKEDADFDGRVKIETYSVKYRKDGSSEFTIVSGLTPAGARTWVRSEDPALAESCETEDVCGTYASVSAGRLRSFEGVGST